MEPWEVMISESQERMVAVVRRELVSQVYDLCERWELHVATIGDVTDTGRLRALWHGEVVGDVEARLLTDECPRYTVETRPRAAQAPRDLTGLADPNLRSRAWVYRRYDQLVGSRTVRRPGLDAAVLRLPPSLRGLAVSLDGPPVGERDPWRAGALAVLDAARNVACAGGRPLALTDCLNFGNPEKPEIAWELERAIAGIAETADALGIPVVSGNVSLYNETDGRAIPPTPVVGCVGLVEDVRRVPSRWREGDAVLLATAAEALDLEAEAALVELLWRAAPRLSLAHDVSDGGLEVALAEAALWSGLGADVDLPGEPLAGAAILACDPAVEVAGTRRIGTVGGGKLLGRKLEELRAEWRT
jgi:phosphoribosylformylglycinamidine synthase